MIRASARRIVFHMRCVLSGGVVYAADAPHKVKGIPHVEYMLCVWRDGNSRVFDRDRDQSWFGARLRSVHIHFGRIGKTGKTVRRCDSVGSWKQIGCCVLMCYNTKRILEKNVECLLIDVSARRVVMRNQREDKGRYIVVGLIGYWVQRADADTDLTWVIGLRVPGGRNDGCDKCQAVWPPFSWQSITTRQKLKHLLGSKSNLKINHAIGGTHQWHHKLLLHTRNIIQYYPLKTKLK